MNDVFQDSLNKRTPQKMIFIWNTNYNLPLIFPVKYMQELINSCNYYYYCRMS